MSVAGYNVDPESSDPVVGIELNQNGKADLYIDEGQGDVEISLDYNEVCELLLRLRQIRTQMEWDRASWVLAYTQFSQKTHVMRKEDAQKLRNQESRLSTIRCPDEPEDDVRPLCGQKPPEYFHWSLTPISGEPHSDCCKRCLSMYASVKREVQDESH